MTIPIKQSRSAHEVGDAWTTVDASELYEIDRWGKGYFGISEAGHVHVHPTKEAGRSIDLKQLIDQLQLRGIALPTLIFPAPALSVSAVGPLTVPLKVMSSPLPRPLSTVIAGAASETLPAKLIFPPLLRYSDPLRVTKPLAV